MAWARTRTCAASRAGSRNARHPPNRWVPETAPSLDTGRPSCRSWPTKLLHIAHVIANRHRRPGLPLEGKAAAEKRNGRHGFVCVENPLDGSNCLLGGHKPENGHQALQRRRSHPTLSLKSSTGSMIAHFAVAGSATDILDAWTSGDRRRPTERLAVAFPRRAIHRSATVRSKTESFPRTGECPRGFIRLSSNFTDRVKLSNERVAAPRSGPSSTGPGASATGFLEKARHIRFCDLRRKK